MQEDVGTKSWRGFVDQVCIPKSQQIREQSKSIDVKTKKETIENGDGKESPVAKPSNNK
jgi:hypothetical protein